MKLLSNKAQEEAIRSINGPVIVISCPGSGKTTTLLRRIHEIVKTGVSAKNILMVTFTNAAAQEMRQRYSVMYKGEESAVFMTIHSLCFNILCREYVCKREDLMTQAEVLDFFIENIHQDRGINDPWEMAKDVISEISMIRNNYVDLTHYKPKACDRQTFMELYKAFRHFKRKFGKIDFDDMLTECKKLFDENPYTLKKYQDMFQYIQCDEYQDVNFIQRDLLYMLAGANKNLCVVGDDDQGIYQFRGAKPEIMLNFKNDFPGCKEVFMGTNYRSAGKIVRVSDALIQHNRVRFQKQFVSERGQNGVEGVVRYVEKDSDRDEMKFLLSKIRSVHDGGVPYNQIAVLARTNAQANAPVRTLFENKIPFYTTEKVSSIYERWIFRCLKKYIDLSLGTGKASDVYYVLNRPNRYLKSSAFENVIYDRKEMLKRLQYLKGEQGWRYEAAEKSVRRWMNLFGPGMITPDTPCREVFDRFSGKGSLHFDKYLDKYADYRNIDRADLMDEYNDLKMEALQHKTVGEWLRYAEQSVNALRTARQNRDKSGVVITTMHQSKGLEWDTVFVIDVNNNVVPHKKSAGKTEAVEEERRLLYVAMTRAKNSLYVMRSGLPSVFMEELVRAVGQSELEESYPIPVVGATVTHAKYGLGILVDYTDDKITVEFAGEQKYFRYPDAFEDGYLEMQLGY